MHFTNAVNTFGGYWGAATSESTPATIRFAFFNAADQLIGTTQAVSYIRLNGDGLLEWHGWHSTVPIRRVNVKAGGTTLAGDSFRAAALDPLFTSITPLGTNWVLKGVGLTNFGYEVETSTNLMNQWDFVGQVNVGTNGAFTFTNNSPLNRTQQFFRLTVVQPDED